MMGVEIRIGDNWRALNLHLGERLLCVDDGTIYLYSDMPWRAKLGPESEVVRVRAAQHLAEVVDLKNIVSLTSPDKAESENAA